ncbi:hypothetical protein OG481_09655 [Streptomyces longwoodensis]|uniref:hypothetical protein n=1 Tax=Streptomyces longwoodensis TaxID=68231 RepID=UPI002DDB9FBD|nr:hypothetical protein [Streptomyces longwoodensis]WRY88781.1 hypothetical protein OG481_09655 [Streptomyces longwoodensis]
MLSRVDVIEAALRHPKLGRPLLAYELGGALVQLLERGTTDPTWTATPRLLAEAIDSALDQAERREKDILATGTPSTADAHALVLERTAPDFVGVCRCGRPIGRTPLTHSLDGLVGLWEQHATQESAWVDAVAALPTAPNGPT